MAAIFSTNLSVDENTPFIMLICKWLKDNALCFLMLFWGIETCILRGKIIVF